MSPVPAWDQYLGRTPDPEAHGQSQNAKALLKTAKRLGLLVYGSASRSDALVSWLWSQMLVQTVRWCSTG